MVGDDYASLEEWNAALEARANHRAALAASLATVARAVAFYSTDCGRLVSITHRTCSGERYPWRVTFFTIMPDGSTEPWGHECYATFEDAFERAWDDELRMEVA
jgi:hypothetical protein